MSDLIPEAEMTIDKLEGLFKSAFIRTERDKDNDLVIRAESGMKTFAKVDPQKRLITFFLLFGLKDRFSDAEKLALINRLNNELIVVRFSMPRPNVLWCDYQFLYDGGLPAMHIITTYRRFESVCEGIGSKDTADIIS